ncbi:MAG: hypothetical protein ABFR95_02950 [Actinomycetota bacterium]
MITRFAVLVAVFALSATACTSAARPAELDGMETGRVGCTAVVADDSPYAMGPVGPGESDMHEPLDGVSVRIEGRDFGVSVTVTEYSEPKGDDMVSNATQKWSDLPTDGEGAEVIRANLDDMHTGVGYIIRCWKGEG